MYRSCFDADWKELLETIRRERRYPEVIYQDAESLLKNTFPHLPAHETKGVITIDELFDRLRRE